MEGMLGGGVREEGWPETSAGLSGRELRWETECVFLFVSEGLVPSGVPENMLVESAGPWAGGDTESPLQNDWEPMAMPLSGELLRLWVWSELGLEAGGREVEPVGEGCE